MNCYYIANTELRPRVETFQQIGVRAASHGEYHHLGSHLRPPSLCHFIV